MTCADASTRNRADIQETLLPARPFVTTIIPTTASQLRADSMHRAVASIRASSSDPVRIVVVVNGSKFDKDLCAWMREQPDIALHFLKQPSLTGAIAKGRRLVETDFFSFLDDDDEYLPGALDARRELINQQPDTAVAACNGLRQVAQQDWVALSPLSQIMGDPLQGMFKGVWLCSCNGLYRSAAVPQSYFDDMHARAEWTWLAYQLLMDGKRVALTDTPGFRIHDTPGSLSKSDEYRHAYFALYERMLDRRPPKAVAALIKGRIAAAWHDQSVHALAEGHRAKAIASHLKSLLLPGGFRYLSYSRHLFGARRAGGDVA